MAPHPVCHNPNTHTMPTGTYGASMWQVRLAPLVLTSTTTCRGGPTWAWHTKQAHPHNSDHTNPRSHPCKGVTG